MPTMERWRRLLLYGLGALGVLLLAAAVASLAVGLSRPGGRPAHGERPL